MRVSVDARGRLEVSCAGGAGPEYSFSPSGPDTFGSSDPLLRDPYEARHVDIVDSVDNVDMTDISIYLHPDW